MKSKSLALVLALVAVFAAGFLLWRQLSGPAVNLRSSAAAGEVLAGEIGRLAGAGKVVIVARQVSEDEPDAMGQRIASFTAALAQGKTVTLAGTEWLAAPPKTMMDMGGLTPEQILAALDKHPGANIAVVFGGLPPFSQAVAEKLAARPIKLAAVCGYGPTVRRWLEARALTLAVVPRVGDAPANAAAPKTPREWFDREFQVVTPDTLAQMPY